ncbi:MAG: hypothetical protein H5T85_06060 [Actinobacteria bacterium]|nr:hypothetical protein [Actinomycetota bacterium]
MKKVLKLRIARTAITTRLTKVMVVLVVFVATVALLFMLGGCKGVFYIPGASYGYYIWEDNGNIFLEWSSDRKDSKFDGVVSTDGEITGCKLKEWEGKDEDSEKGDIIKVGRNRIEFSATLDSKDFSDGFSFTLRNFTYLEFDLKINDGYDLSRINVGGFLENPESNVFRIEKDYFDKLKMKHWYQKHPFSEFFYKLFSNKYFTFLYLFILGVIVIEILRITILYRKRKKPLWLGICYAGLILVEVCIYFILRFLVQ